MCLSATSIGSRSRRGSASTTLTMPREVSPRTASCSRPYASCRVREDSLPNLLVRFGQGSVERGGVHLGPAVRGRRRGEWYLPESGRLVEDGGALR
jgi:hypothetical protein